MVRREVGLLVARFSQVFTEDRMLEHNIRTTVDQDTKLDYFGLGEDLKGDS